MKSRVRRAGLTSKSLFYAIVIHLIVGVLLVLNFDWPTKVVSSPRPQPAPVQANVVDENEIQKQMEEIRKKRKKSGAWPKSSSVRKKRRKRPRSWQRKKSRNSLSWQS